MKYFPLNLALLAGFVLSLLLLAPASRAATGVPPAAVLLVDPEENGQIPYMRVASETPDDPSDGLFYLTLVLTNTGGSDLVLTNLETRFTNPNNTTFTRRFERKMTLKSGQVGTTYLAHEELVFLPEVAPVSVQVSLFFTDYPRPISFTRTLVAYDPPVPGGKYVFPSDEIDLGRDYYFTGSSHEAGAVDSQFLGYDLKVVDISGGLVRAGGSSKTNEDYYGWRTPMRALADGIVLSVSSGFEDNPAGRRRFQEMAHHDGEAIADAKVTRLTDTRAATALRLPSGALKIVTWDLADRGRQIHQRGSIVAENVEDIAAVSLGTNRLVTAVRLVGGQIRVIVWDVDVDGNVTRYSEYDDQVNGVAQIAKEIAVVKLTVSRLAIALRLSNDNLRLVVLDVEDNGATPSVYGTGSAGVCSFISLAALSGSRLAGSLRNSRGELQVIVWNVLDAGANPVVRASSAAAPDTIITRVVSAKNIDRKWVTAARRNDGTLKLIRWDVSADGSNIVRGIEGGGEGLQDTDLAMSVSTHNGTRRYDNDFIVSTINSKGESRYVGWSDPSDNPGVLEDSTDATSVGANQLSIDAMADLEYLSAIRTAGGTLKLQTWIWAHGGGNCLNILHGNCRVLYAHFRNGSLNPAVAFPGARVSAGQFLAEMGNSGAAGLPHTHIHSDRLPPGFSLAQMIDLQSRGELPSIGTRPIPFYCARALRRDLVVLGGDEANTYAPMNGHGTYTTGAEPHYFPTMLIRPGRKVYFVDRSSTCILPNGQRECGFPFPIGGPFPAVAQALNACCWGNQLYIRVGNYPEAVTFDTSMTVQSYDGTAVIGN